MSLIWLVPVAASSKLIKATSGRYNRLRLMSHLVLSVVITLLCSELKSEFSSSHYFSKSTVIVDFPSREQMYTDLKARHSSDTLSMPGFWVLQWHKGSIHISSRRKQLTVTHVPDLECTPPDARLSPNGPKREILIGFRLPNQSGPTPLV